MTHEYDGVIGIINPEAPGVLEVRIKFCTCDGILKDDKRIHNVAEMYQFIAIHCQEVAHIYGHVSWHDLTLAVIAYPIQQNHMHIVPSSGVPPSHKYTMMVEPILDGGYWPRIDLQDQDYVNDNDLVGMLKDLGASVYVFDEQGPHQV